MMGSSPTSTLLQGGGQLRDVLGKRASDLSVQEAWVALTAAVSKLNPQQQNDMATRIAFGALDALGADENKEG